MIDGVTVVASRQWQPSLIGLIVIGILMYGMCAGEIFAATKLWRQLTKLSEKLIIIAVSVLCVIVVTGMMIFLYQAHEIVHTYYTVEVDDTASFNEFNRTFEIISHDEESGLYEVELKEATS